MYYVCFDLVRSLIFFYKFTCFLFYWIDFYIWFGRKRSATDWKVAKCLKSSIMDSYPSGRYVRLHLPMKMKESAGNDQLMISYDFNWNKGMQNETRNYLFKIKYILIILNYRFIILLQSDIWQNSFLSSFWP